MTPPIPILILLSMFSLAEDPDLRRTAVENGLFGTVRVEGATWSIEERMGAHQVPACSVAVIVDGALSWAAGYGRRDAVFGGEVGPKTRFQAASISKAISSIAVLDLVEEGKLDLEADVNGFLEGWQLRSELAGTESPKVTLAHLLSHTGGTTVHGFGGYRRSAELPTVVDILGGSAPANSGPVFVDLAPGSATRYSGGGSTVAQLAVTSVTGRPFEAVLADRVLGPLGMGDSSYAQPLDPAVHPDHASAHGFDGRRVPGGFHVYPEQFAAGLWTTPTDLARVLCATRAALLGAGEHPLELATLLEQFEPRGDGSFGLGFQLEGGADELSFGHDGANEGFFCTARIQRDSGCGAVVMTNGTGGMALMREVMNAIRVEYAWDGVDPEELAVERLSAEELAGYAGRYLVDDETPLLVEPKGALLRARLLPQRPTTWAPLGEGRFLDTESNRTWIFDGESGGFVRGTSRLAKRALRLGPQDPEGVLELLCTDRRSEALDVLAAGPAPQGFEDERAIARTLTRLASAGDHAAAGDLATWAAERYPGSIDLAAALARAQDRLGNIDRAAAAYARVHELAGGDEAHDRLLGEAAGWLAELERERRR